jgi:hypothetical protein
MHDTPQGHSPHYWRDMANEARTIADGLATEATRTEMLELARKCERFAKEAQWEQERSRDGHADIQRHNR